jgi:hypothetical protein
MSFDFELLMLKPTPVQEKGISIFFSPHNSNGVDTPLPVVDRKQLLQHLLPSLSMEWPAKLASKLPVDKNPPKEGKVVEMKEEEKEVKENANGKAIPSEYQSHKDTVRGRLVIQAPGNPWICPHIALLEGTSDKVVCVYSKVAEKTWWGQILDEKDAEMQFWEYVSGGWNGSRDKPSNFRQLADVDQDAIREQMLNELKKKYKLLRYNEDAVPGDASSSVVLLDDVEDFCESVVQKNVDAVRLYNHLMSSADLRIVALTQYPCYRDPGSLVHLFNLLHGYVETSSSSSHKRFTKQQRGGGAPTTRTTKRRHRKEKQAPQHTTKSVLLFPQQTLPNDFYERVKHMIVVLSTDAAGPLEPVLERCEMTEQQYQLYRHASDDDLQRRKCCTFALDQPLLVRKKEEVEDVVQQALYEREVARIVDEQDVSVPTLEKCSPKFLRALKNIQQHKGKGSIAVFTPFEVEGQLFRSMLEKNGFQSTEEDSSEDATRKRVVVLRSEEDVVRQDRSVPQIYLIVSPSDDMWYTGSSRLVVDAIHLLDIPDETWVQTLRICRKFAAPFAENRAKLSIVVYLSTFSQSMLVKHKLLDQKSKLTQESQEKDGSELYRYCQHYLGDAPATITADQQLLEELFVKNHVIFKHVEEMVR